MKVSLLSAGNAGVITAEGENKYQLKKHSRMFLHTNPQSRFAVVNDQWQGLSPLSEHVFTYFFCFSDRQYPTYKVYDVFPFSRFSHFIVARPYSFVKLPKQVLHGRWTGQKGARIQWPA